MRWTQTPALDALAQAGLAAATTAAVFASSSGNPEIVHQVCEALARPERDVSPTRFHNSVHNAPSGYFSIGHQNRQSALSVSLGRESFASGLLCAVSEAQSSGQPVLFLSYDVPMPQPMRSLLRVEQPSATAWIVAAAGTVREHDPLASFELSLHAPHEAEPAAAAWLPATWADNPSAQGFVALAMLADGPAECDFPLGAQRLRLARVDGVARC